MHEGSDLYQGSSCLLQSGIKHQRGFWPKGLFGDLEGHPVWSGFVQTSQSLSVLIQSPHQRFKSIHLKNHLFKVKYCIASQKADHIREDVMVSFNLVFSQSHVLFVNGLKKKDCNRKRAGW